MNVIVGISWPFANGDLHIGHAASSLVGDVIARYHRQKGDKVIMVSGTDCHGTPIDVKALKEKKSAKELVDECHTSFTKDFQDLGFSYDLFNRTDDVYHKDFVKEQFKKYYELGYLYEVKEEQLYCSHCELFLADRYIIGVCPKCGADVKGDECEKCGSLLEINNVLNTKCAICGNKTEVKSTQNLYFSLSKFQDDIKKLVDLHEHDWRDNAVVFTKRYLAEGVPDRCASRSLNWGIDIPIKGYEDKKIYGWFENVWGYVTASKKYCDAHNLNWEEYWKNGYDNRIYLVHAKDNIPFHTVIFPSLLLATQENYHLPDKIVSDNHVTIEGEKLSKSKGNYISLRHLLDNYPADAIRYFFISNEAINKDFNFSWHDFINSLNGELLGKWGNFVNRTLVFINKSFKGTLNNYPLDSTLEDTLKNLYPEVGNLIADGNAKEALAQIFAVINQANKYFDDMKPWELAKTDEEKCQEVLFNCCNIIYNINTVLKPFLPFSTKVVEEYLNIINDNWEYQALNQVKIKPEIEPLYPRYDKSVITTEINNLKNK